jgi:hypothetical protein
MNSPHRHGYSLRLLWPLALAGIVLILSCEPPVKQPVGPARDYADAKDLFKKGNFDRTLEYTEGVASASPPNAYTERARVLRLIIYSGRVKAYKQLTDAYAKGSQAAKNPRFKAEYQRLRSDALDYGTKAALGVGETAHQMLEGAGIGKEVTLEAPYPATEGPQTLPQLERVMEGAWIEPQEQDAASLGARQKGIDDALAEAVGGDRTKARTELTAGPVKIGGVDFALFLGHQLLDAASMFDRKHYNDFQKFKLIADEGDQTVQAALAMLKESPDKDKEKEVKKLDAAIKAAIKKNS